VKTWRDLRLKTRRKQCIISNREIIMRMMRRFAAVTAVLLPMSMASTAAYSQDIVDVASKAGTFKTLVTALKAADLVDTLKGAGPFTVFAPTDAAFKKLPKGTLASLLKPENKAELRRILTYHVLAGKVMSGDIKGKKLSPKTVEGSTLAVDARKGVRVGKAKVTKADIAASNGVIHVVDTVILPPAKKTGTH